MVAFGGIGEVERPGAEVVGHDNDQRACIAWCLLEPFEEIAQASVGVGKRVFLRMTGKLRVAIGYFERFV